MRCKNCGTKNRDGAKYCRACGAKIEEGVARPFSRLQRRALWLAGCVALLLLLAVALRLFVRPTSPKEGNVLNQLPNQASAVDGDCSVKVLKTATQIENQDQAREALIANAEDLRIVELSDQLGACQVDDSGETTTYRFDREYSNIPVYGQSVVMEVADSQDGIAVTHNAMGDIACETTPAISLDDAIAAVGASYGNVSSLVPRGLCIYPLVSSEPVLCYRLLVTSGSFAGDVFVSARDASLVAQRSGIVDVEATGKDIDGQKRTFSVVEVVNPMIRGKYAMIDTLHNITVYDANGAAPSEVIAQISLEGLHGATYHLGRAEDGHYRYMDRSNNIVNIDDSSTNIRDWVVTNDDGSTDSIIQTVYDYESHLVTSSKTKFSNKRAVTVLTRLADVLDFYTSVLFRNGFNNEGAPIHLVCNIDDDNAFAWAPSRDFVHIGTGSKGEFMGLDVLGHEYTHAVIGSMVKDFGTSSEASLLNEALADVFGELVQDYADGDMNNSCDWQNGVRSQSNPESMGQPSRYRGDHWVMATDENRDAFCHTNSTVVSHAAYLMCNGDLEGDVLKTDELARVLYRSIKTLPANCDVATFAGIVELNASRMLSPAKARRVSAAFQAAEITPAAFDHLDGDKDIAATFIREWYDDWTFEDGDVILNASPLLLRCPPMIAEDSPLFDDFVDSCSSMVGKYSRDFAACVVSEPETEKVSEGVFRVTISYVGAQNMVDQETYDRMVSDPLKDVWDVTVNREGMITDLVEVSLGYMGELQPQESDASMVVGVVRVHEEYDSSVAGKSVPVVSLVLDEPLLYTYSYRGESIDAEAREVCLSVDYPAGYGIAAIRAEDYTFWEGLDGRHICVEFTGLHGAVKDWSSLGVDTMPAGEFRLISVEDNH